MLVFLISLVLIGLLVGALARLLVPGPDPMGFGATILLGIAGSLIAGLLAGLLFGRGAGFVFSVLVTVGLVLLIRRTRSPARQ
jgi:uncharacterized membrane protein YeaQ/YmgE (transglycosylase-associated protein family)